MTTSTTRNFRRDINGLRAWAVMAVVLFHFNVFGFDGGFIGVDVFFVISGYLMTGIIVRGLEAGNFSPWNFYLARGRRIIPALAVTGLVVLALGWFLLMPGEYQTLGRHLRDSLLFTSNLQYLSESGYFDSDAHEKWLLHTWSLSVEWQFYLLLPLLLMAIWRWSAGRTAIIRAHILLGLLSFGLCLHWTATVPEQAFYLIYTRAWEMLAGGLVFLLPLSLNHAQRRLRSILSAAGLLLILASATLLDASSPWPGWRALLPVLGTALVIAANDDAMPLTSGSVMQWLGTRSYSIYLWHWPIVAALAYFEVLGVYLWVLLGIGGSLILGTLSYSWVEVPAQAFLSRMTIRRGIAVLLVLTVCVSSLAQLVRLSGFPARLPAAIADIEAYRHDRNPRQDDCLGSQSGCLYGGEQVVGIMLGDSHADAVITAAETALPDPSQAVYFRGASSCLLVFGATRVDETKDSNCAIFKRQMERDLASLHPGLPVIVINATTGYAFGDADKGVPKVYFTEPVRKVSPQFLQEFREHYLQTACQIARSHPLLLMRPTPGMPVKVPDALAKSLLLHGKYEDVRILKSDYMQRHSSIWALQDEAAARCGARILDPLPYLCDDEYCYGSRDGVPIYSDEGHLSEHGNRYLVPMFQEAYRGLGIGPANR